MIKIITTKNTLESIKVGDLVICDGILYHILRIDKYMVNEERVIDIWTKGKILDSKSITHILKKNKNNGYDVFWKKD